MDANDEAGRRIPPPATTPASLAKCALRRQTPAVGAECPNWARSDLCGGAQQWASLPLTLYRTRVALRGQNADRDEGRLSGGLRQAAAQRRLQEGPVRQPARAAREKPGGASGRGAERDGARALAASTEPQLALG